MAKFDFCDLQPQNGAQKSLRQNRRLSLALLGDMRGLRREFENTVGHWGGHKRNEFRVKILKKDFVRLPIG